ncbi:MAG: hypothetical protein FJZ38_21670 [Candidatus Rokubacteria bacterium]|nr:hypothetical protein [Candidatus Rokubacteria bacterium]
MPRLAIALLALLGLGATDCANPECVKLGHPGAAYWKDPAAELTRQLQGGGAKAKTVVPINLRDLGGVEKAFDILTNKHVDVAVVPHAIFARKVPAFDVLNLPAEIRDLRHAGRVSGSSLEKRLRDEAAKAKLRLLGFAWRGGTFYSKVKCLVSPLDVRGAKILDGRDQHATVLTSAGASVVELGPEIFLAFDRGLGDSVLVTIELLDVLKPGGQKHCLTRPGTSPFMILAAVIVATLDPGGTDTLGPPIVDRLGTFGPQATVRVERAGEALEKKYAAAKAEVKPMGEKERAEWDKLAAPLTGDYLKRVESGKVLLDELRKLREAR